jgi:hypothetical protein
MRPWLVRVHTRKPSATLAKVRCHPRADSCRGTIIYADLSEAEFVQIWRGVPAWLRAITYLAAPAVGISRRWFGTREELARGMSFEDLPRRQETLTGIQKLPR